MKRTEENDPLIKMAIHVAIKHATPTSIVDLGIDDASASLANAHQALARQQIREIASDTSETVDATVTQAQGILNGAKSLNGDQIIGGLVNALDTVVKLGDELSAVSHYAETSHCSSSRA